MRVRFDAQTFMRQRFGGISRYFTTLIAELDAAPELGIEPVVDFTWTPNAYAARHLAARGVRAIDPRVPRAVPYGWAWLRAPFGQSPADAVHQTYYSARFLASPPGTRRVVTVHDMIPERLAGTDGFTSSHLAKRRYVDDADLVVCVSESTRADLLDLWGPLRAPAVVVPLAVGPAFAPGLAPVPGLPADYVLYSGARRGYKDFLLLVDALAALRADGLDVPLVVAGGSLTRAEADAFARRGPAPVVLEHPSDDQLARAVSAAALVVQTSRYEGFGLATLEAMASGVPAVAADAGPMREVGGDVVEYFRPGDGADLARAMGRVLGDPSVRERMARLGPPRAALFSGRRLAESMAAAYRLMD